MTDRQGDEEEENSRQLISIEYIVVTAIVVGNMMIFFLNVMN